MWILVNVECESCGGQASIALLEEAPDLSDRREIEGCIHSKVYETQIDPNSIAYVHPNQLKYLDHLDLILLKRAAEKYLEGGPNDVLYLWKVLEHDFMNKQKGYLWRIFQDFFFNDRLYQLLWIPEISERSGN